MHLPEMGERRMLQNCIHVTPFQSISDILAIEEYQLERHIFYMRGGNTRQGLCDPWILVVDDVDNELNRA
jgi:hypothetical protein